VFHLWQTSFARYKEFTSNAVLGLFSLLNLQETGQAK